jgi:hypothetical protein
MQGPGINLCVRVNHEVDSITYNDRVIMGKMVAEFALVCGFKTMEVEGVL